MGSIRANTFLSIPTATEILTTYPTHVVDFNNVLQHYSLNNPELIIKKLNKI